MRAADNVRPKCNPSIHPTCLYFPDHGSDFDGRPLFREDLIDGGRKKG